MQKDKVTNILKFGQQYFTKTTIVDENFALDKVSTEDSVSLVLKSGDQILLKQKDLLSRIASRAKREVFLLPYFQSSKTFTPQPITELSYLVEPTTVDYPILFHSFLLKDAVINHEGKIGLKFIVDNPAALQVLPITFIYSINRIMKEHQVSDPFYSYTSINKNRGIYESEFFPFMVVLSSHHTQRDLK